MLILNLTKIRRLENISTEAWKEMELSIPAEKQTACQEKPAML